jgi:protein-S-isoprenylcysteine O-methyltransferase Ste14
VSDKSRGYAYVAMQFVLLGVLLTAPRLPQPYGTFTPLISLVGLALMAIAGAVLLVSFVGLGNSLTASPLPKAQGQLVTTGLYAYVRHPIYFGLLLLSAGVVLDAGWWPQAVVAVMLYVLLRIKAQFEESLLQKAYPSYAAYAAKTPRFFPRLGK